MFAMLLLCCCPSVVVLLLLCKSDVLLVQTLPAQDFALEAHGHSILCLQNVLGYNKFGPSEIYK